MIDIITVLFRTTVTQMVSDRVKVFMQQALDDMNASRHASSSSASSNAAYSPVFEVLRTMMAKQGIQLPVPEPVGGQ